MPRLDRRPMWRGRQGADPRACLRGSSSSVVPVVVGLSVLLLWPCVAASPVEAQEARPQDGWNTPRVLELVERARVRRQEPLADSALRTYRADATGHVYFFLDREDEGEPVLLRADQAAVELFWAQPDRTKQVIRGMRSEEQFPIRDFRYYLDRYTVIQNGFGDEIRVGEGRDVADVMHPLAPRAEAVYSYRLADSLTIRLPADEELRVYEVQVRPEDFSQPAIVGSLFLERARGDLVRLAFTFTPAAYLDERNERVEVALENALWEGRYWLPREQRLMVRREMPELDLDVGTVIRAVLRVSDYELNPPIPTTFFYGREVVVAAGPGRLAEYPFEDGLYDALPEVGAAPGDELGTLDEVDVDEIAGRIVRQRFLRGVPRVRFYAPNVSALLRYDRAEGLVTGAGLSYGLGEYQLTGYGGYAWGAGEPTGEVALTPLSGGSALWSAKAYYRRPVELGLRDPAAGALSSVVATFDTDYRDLYFESGATLTRRLGQSAMAPEIGLRVARHTSPSQVAAATSPPFNQDDSFRPVLPIEGGTQMSVLLRSRSVIGAPWGGELRLGVALEGGHFDGRQDKRWFATSGFDLDWVWRGEDLRWGIQLRQKTKKAWNGVIQHGSLVGGRNTLPGHPHHAYHSDNAVVQDLEGWFAVVPRWLRLRGIAATALLRGGSDLQLEVPGTRPWLITTGEDASLSSLGVGLGLVDGIIRVDYVRGFGGHAASDGVVILSIDPRLWGVL